MDYRIKRVGQSDELEHALFGIGKKKSSSSLGSGSGQQGAKKGSTWSNHLYIARQKAGDGWRYFYSQAELNAAKAKGAAKQAAKTVGDTARRGLTAVKRSAADLKGYAGKVDSDRNRYKEAIDKANRQGTNALRRAVNAENARNSDNARAYISWKGYGNIVDAKSNAKWYEFGKRAKLTEAAEDALNNYRHYNASSDKNQARLNNAEAAKDRYYKDRDTLRSDRDAYNKNVNEVKYGLSVALNAVDKAIGKGKSAISKFLSDESAMAKEAWNGSIAKKAIDKGKNAIDALAKWRRDVSASHVTFTSDLPSLSKSGKKYYKDAIKNLTDEEIEQDYLSAKRKNSTSPQENDKFELLTAERNYRVASREADRLGRLTDTKSDAAEAALKKYGQDSPQYKKAFDEMEEAFDQLHEAELELARYEKNR